MKDTNFSDFFDLSCNAAEIQKFPTIYKRTSTGAVQEWRQEILVDKYRTISGQQNGKHVVSEWTICIPTNVGKKNERNGAAQALFEVAAAYKKKIDKEYHEDIKDIDVPKHFLPMLAEDFKKNKDKLFAKNSKLYSQPKLDGMRCIATKNGLFSRNALHIVSCPHIVEQLKPFFEKYPHIVLDGELYNHEYKDNFDELMSIFKRTKPSKEDLEKSKELGQFHIYDCANSVELRNFPFRMRTATLGAIIGEGLSARYGNILKECESIVIVPTSFIYTAEDAKNLLEKYLSEGYEGQIIRTDAEYQNKRTKDLLKDKEWKDSEFELIRFEEGKGNWAGKAKKAWFKLDDGSGREFKASVKGTMAYTKQLLIDKDKYVGKMCTVTYCPQRTPDGIPRFGRVKEFDRTDNITK